MRQADASNTTSSFRRVVRQWTISTVLVRLVALIVLWLILSGGEVRYWGLVAGAIIAGALMSLTLVPESGVRWSFTGLFRLSLFFLVESVRGGVDVASRALSTTPRVDPVYVVYRLRLREEPARVLLANTMSLMPGSLSVALHGEELTLHVLDREMATTELLRKLEVHVARTLAVELRPIESEVASESETPR